MKYLFHMLFATALLLGSLILFNRLESETANLASETPGMELMGLQAELGNSQSAVSPVLSHWLQTVKLKGPVSGIFNPRIAQKLDEQRIRLNKQIAVHWELKPLIANQSGQYLQNHSRGKELPVS